MWVYFFVLIATVLFLFFAGSFVHINQNYLQTLSKVQQFALRQLFTLSALISGFAIITTNGKTSLWVIFFICFYLLARREIQFKRFSFAQLKGEFKFLLWIIPVILLQLFFHTKLPNFEFSIPSNDVIVYAKIALGIVETGTETQYFPASLLYPEAFNGLTLYHFFELYFAGIIYWITGLSTTFLLNLVVYPFLGYFLILAVRSLQDQLDSKVTAIKKSMIVLLLFIGPIYFNFYGSVFNDGEIMNTTVFSIGGFIRQTLPFSYFGQKHLPVYLFGAAAIFFLLRKEYRLFFAVAIVLGSASIGTFVAVVAACFAIILFNRSLWNFKYIGLLIGLISLLLLPYLLLKAEVSKLSLEGNLYFQYFLQELNWKGELLRVISKFIVPFFWFSILYSPFLLLFVANWKILRDFPRKKDFTAIITMGFLAGCSTLIFLTGMNTDQFLTNTLPLFNLCLIVLVLYLMAKTKLSSLSFLLILILGLYNLGYAKHYFYHQHKEIGQLGEPRIQQFVLNDLANSDSNKMAYVVSDSLASAIPPLIWYPSFPGKYFMIYHNLFSIYNLNWPYRTYPKTSASLSFSHENQMKFYLNHSRREKDGFDSVQLRFLQEKDISWLVIAKGADIPESIRSHTDTLITDTITNERYLRMR